MSFEVSEDRYGTFIRDPESDYRLRVVNDGNYVGFFVPHMGKGGATVTMRDLDEYRRLLKDKLPEPKPGEQVVELGAGLGELVPAMAERKDLPPPIVVDPADYPSMRRLLEHAIDNAEELGFVEGTRARLREALRRCDVLLDSSKVRLISEPFPEVLERHPDLRNSADVLVELYGPRFVTPKDDATRQIGEAARRRREAYGEVLKPRGAFATRDDYPSR